MMKNLAYLARGMKTSLLLAVFIFNCLPWTSHCCSPIENAPPETVERTVSFSNRIAYGTVIERQDSMTFPNAYTVTMEIFCVFKGDPVARYINITNEGLAGGMCFYNDLVVNSSYVVFLTDFDADPYVFDEAEKEVMGITDPYFEQLTRVCNLTTLYPIGVDELNAKVQCPATAKDPDCILYKEPTHPQTGPIPTEVTSPDLPPIKDFTSPEAPKESRGTDLDNPSPSKSVSLSHESGIIFTLLVSIGILCVS